MPWANYTTTEDISQFFVARVLLELTLKCVNGCAYVCVLFLLLLFFECFFFFWGGYVVSF